jgi:hypothetical protein
MRRDAAASLLRDAAARSPPASKSIRVIDTVIIRSPSGTPNQTASSRRKNLRVTP